MHMYMYDLFLYTASLVVILKAICEIQVAVKNMQREQEEQRKILNSIAAKQFPLDESGLPEDVDLPLVTHDDVRALEEILNNKRARDALVSCCYVM